MSNAIKWGVILGIASIILALVLHLTGLSDPTATGAGKYIPWLLSLLVASPILFMGIKAFKASNDNFLTVGNGLVQGLVIALVSAIIYAIYTYVFYKYVEPDYLKAAVDAAIEQQGEMSADEEELMTSMMSGMMNPGVMAGYIVFLRVFLGLIVGLIAGAILKNVRPYSQDSL